MTLSKIEDRVRCPNVERHQTPGETCFVWYRALPRRSRSRQSNESAVGSSCASLEFTSALKTYPKGVDAVENLQNRKNSKRAKVYLDSAQKLNCGTIAEGHFNEQYRMRMREQGYTQTLMEESDRIALERKNDVATHKERCTTETDTRSCNPHMEEAATP